MTSQPVKYLFLDSMTYLFELSSHFRIRIDLFGNQSINFVTAHILSLTANSCLRIVEIYFNNIVMLGWHTTALK